METGGAGTAAIDVNYGASGTGFGVGIYGQLTAGVTNIQPKFGDGGNPLTVLTGGGATGLLVKSDGNVGIGSGRIKVFGTSLENQIKSFKGLSNLESPFVKIMSN
ncbi:MAG: hypothetical protein AAB729_03365 [Patescibacteria group bacterium]